MIAMKQLEARRAPPSPLAHMPRARKAPTCIFCSGADIVATPLWPQWLDQRCPGPSQQLNPSLVCTQCSEGWMTELDRQAEQLLTPVLDGAPGMWSRAQMRVVSGWLCLLAVKLADGSGIPWPDRLHLRRAGEPPQNWSIFAAGLHKTAGLRFCRRYPCRIEFSGNPIAGHSRGRNMGVSNALLLSMGIGPLFFHLFSSPSLIHLHDFTAASRGTGLAQIWPPARRFGVLAQKPIRMPPDRVLTDEEAHRVTEASSAQLRARLRHCPESPDED